MQATTYQADLERVKEFLYTLIKENASPEGLEWLNKQLDKLKQEWNYRTFYFSFSSVPRFMGKASIPYDKATLSKANALREGFTPQGWDMTQLTRTYILLFLPHDDLEAYALTIDRMCETADMYEQQALYAALPILPHPKELTGRAAEGIRTNMTNVFDAIALHNPYPADYLQKEAWNQLLLKAVFMGRPLYKIYHADKRANPELAHMLIDFAHERWAAHRQISPEVWRFVAPYLNEAYLSDLEKSVKDGAPLEVEAALLACSENTYSGGKMLLDQHPDIKGRIERGDISWENIGERYLTNE
ncbi:EboA domain-containing protein [Catalinimonas sp. 4WD22]|uniref:EboA domain-containing protein n=1 Tax=Catalinimonas locisalis TaxID=3133978 RepID=UPI003100E782